MTDRTRRGPFGNPLERVCAECDGLRVPCSGCLGERLVAIPRPHRRWTGAVQCGSCAAKSWTLQRYGDHYAMAHM